MKRELIGRSARGLVGETKRSSALLRAIAGTVGGALLVWGLGLPWIVLVVLALLAVIYVLVSRVLRLEPQLAKSEQEFAELRQAEPAPTPREVRDRLSGFAAEMKKLKSGCRPAFDAGTDQWTEWKEESSTLRSDAADAVHELLGIRSSATSRKSQPIFVTERRDRATRTISWRPRCLCHRARQLEGWIADIPRL
jgi:hypothetical protein